MAYFSSPKSNKSLINGLVNQGIIRSHRVEEAMQKVDRMSYCPQHAYSDSPQGIGYGVTISAPHMHAYALEILSDHAKEGAKVLDVGCGSGYLTACLAYMVGETGTVVGIEHLHELVDLSRKNIRRGNPELLAEGCNRVKLVYGDGRLGWKEDAPYDAIHVGAGAPEMPEELIAQLKNGGRLVCPVGDFGYGAQRLTQVDRDENGHVHVKRLMDVMFVPLCDADEQWSGARRHNPETSSHSGEPPMPYVE